MSAAKRATLHPVLKAALKFAKVTDFTEFQAGGPAVRVVKFEGPACLSLAVWQTGLLEGTLAASERAEYSRLMKLAADSPQLKYRELGVAPVSGSPALTSAGDCVHARQAAAGGYDSRAAGYAADITERVLAQLFGKQAAVDQFLTELDDRLMAYELAAAARMKGGAEFAQFERVLWRGTDAKGDCVLWVARVSRERYAILSKVGARWKWVEGSRDDTLAAVPDASFAAATKVAIARDQQVSVKVRLPVRGKDADNFWTVDFVDRR